MSVFDLMFCIGLVGRDHRCYRKLLLATMEIENSRPMQSGFLAVFWRSPVWRRDRDGFHCRERHQDFLLTVISHSVWRTRYP